VATITVKPGATVEFDPSDKKTIIFDFDALNLASAVTLTNGAPLYGITITVLKQNGATILTMDNPSLLTGSRKVQARFLATTATLGDKYRVACKGITNESPVQEKEYSIFIVIQDH